MVRRSLWGDDNLVQVIIPTFNRKDILLSRALPSVLTQTHDNMLVIVVDHGSSDGTYEALAKWARVDSRLVVERIRRSELYPPTAENHWLCGPVQPLNAALDMVDGEYGWIARIDDDDVWSPDHLDTMLTFAREGQYEFVSSAHDGPNGKASPYILGDGILVGGCQTWLYRSYLRFFRYNKDCWRKTWNRVNDTDLQDRMWRAGVRMGYLDKVTCRVDPRPGTNSVGLAYYLQNRDTVESAYAF